MAARSTKTIPGSQWQRDNAQHSVALTLDKTEHLAFGALAGGSGVSKAEAARRLVRWALAQVQSTEGEKKIRKILATSIDSAE